MAVKRSGNWLGQARIDTPAMRSIESAASSDFDDFIKATLIGSGDGYIVRGFRLSMANAVGSAATSLQLIVSDSAILHPTSSTSGTFYLVAPGTAPEALNPVLNTKIQGSFTPNAINYIGLEYLRAPDDSTNDTTYLWDPTTKTETQKVLPAARLLSYKIVITTSVWASNVLPIAKISTDSVNNVTSITDQRAMLGRLGTAGRNTPNPSYNYPWTQGRTEAAVTATSNATDPFVGGDKQLGSMKDWMDAVMTTLLEVKGTPYWYSANTAGSMVNLRTDLGSTVITGTGIITHDQTIAGRINWSSDVYLKVIGSRLKYRIAVNASSSDITLADEQVAYLTLVRGKLVASPLVWNSGSPTITSVGNVSWTTGLSAGDFIKLSSADDSQYYQIQSIDSTYQITLTENFVGTSSGPTGAQSSYAWGSYLTSPVPSSDRNIRVAARKDVPNNDSIVWLFYRSDNGGADPLVYFKLTGEELTQGEEIDITDTVTKNILQYIGAPKQSSKFPVYSTQLGPVTAQQTLITVGSATTISTGQNFRIFANDGNLKYQVWFNKNGAGGLVPIPDYIAISVPVNTGDSAIIVGASLASAFLAISGSPFTVVDHANGTITVTNVQPGHCPAPANNGVPSPFSLSVTTTGTGFGNVNLTDGDSLTLSIKKLDKELGQLQNILGEAVYNEDLLISASPANSHERLPAVPSDVIQLPPNTRDFNAPGKYVSGSGRLEVYLRGQRLILGNDYTEMGAPGDLVDQITALRNFNVGDTLSFVINMSNGQTIIVNGGGGGGSGTGITKADLYDPVSTSLPSGPTATIDGTAVSNGMTVVFGNISVNKNRLYKAAGVGTAITWTAQSSFPNGLDPFVGDTIVISLGTAFARTIGIFDGTSFQFNDRVRYFNGTDYWEISNLKQASIINNSIGTVFSIAAAGSENCSINYSIVRGSAKESGTIQITHNGSSLAFNQDFAGLSTTGITLTPVLSAGNLVLNYASTNLGTAATIKFYVARWSDSPGGPAGLPSYSGGGSSVSAAGNNTEIQFNDSGALGADSTFTFDKTTKEFGMGALKEEILKSVTLLDNQVTPAQIFSLNAATYPHVIVEYSITRNGHHETGRLLIATDGTNVGFNQDSVDTFPTGIALTAVIVGSNLSLQYISTLLGVNGTMKYTLRKWQ